MWSDWSLWLSDGSNGFNNSSILVAQVTTVRLVVEQWRTSNGLWLGPPRPLTPLSGYNKTSYSSLIPRPLTPLSGYNITSYSSLIPRPLTPLCKKGSGYNTISYSTFEGWGRGGTKMPEFFPSQTSSGTCIASSIIQY